jgi:hypothetical protein
MTSIPKKKKDQLSLAQDGINCLRNRPDPDDPGGLGAEESGTERTGPTQDSLLAIQRGSRWAEVGQYYDCANDPVTAFFWPGMGLAPPHRFPNAGCFVTALLQPRAVGAIMSLR